MKQMKNDWIRRSERLPNKEDGDAQGAVIAWHVWNGVMVTNYANVQSSTYFLAWMRCPKAPEDALERREQILNRK